jgi:hypothetical protein
VLLPSSARYRQHSESSYLPFTGFRVLEKSFLFSTLPGGVACALRWWFGTGTLDDKYSKP